MRHLTGAFVIAVSAFLAFDSGSFYGSQYPGFEWLGYALSGLAYTGFVLIARESIKYDGLARWLIGLTLGVFIVVNTLSAAAGAASELIDQWGATMSIERNAGAVEKLADLSREFGRGGQKLNAAKMGESFRKLTVDSVANYEPLAWVKIVLILLIRLLLEVSVLILSVNHSNRMPVDSEPSESATEPATETVTVKRWQPKLDGAFISKDKLERLIPLIEKKIELGESFKYVNGTYGGEKAKKLLSEAKELLTKIREK
jgi:hypothetical protein